MTASRSIESIKKLLDHQVFEVIKKASAEIGVESYVIGGFVRPTL